LNRAQKPQQVGHLRNRDLAWRHSSRGQALANQCGKLLTVAGSQARRDRGPHWASVAIAAMAWRAAIFKGSASRIDILREKVPTGEE
jgi:hypothetical protein